MAAAGKAGVRSWPLVVPGIALVSLVIGANLLADGLRDFADPTRGSA